MRKVKVLVATLLFVVTAATLYVRYPAPYVPQEPGAPNAAFTLKAADTETRVADGAL
jgi:hypothetical protein